MPICWRAQDVVQQASAGSHVSPAPASTIPSPHRERSPVKCDDFLFGLERTANVPVTRAHVAASITARRVALPESPVHADHVTRSVVVRRLALIFFAVVVGQPLAIVTCDPATVRTSVAGPASLAISGAESR
jgi:hypothetical protein